MCYNGSLNTHDLGASTLSGFFNLFKPDPHLPEIQDKEVVDSKYKYWRIRTLYSIFIGYALYYVTRKTLSALMPLMVSDLGFTKENLGILVSVFSVTYGISKFGNGILSDRSNPRYFMAFGLIMTGIFNICFGLSSSILLFVLFWGLNGWFQGCGWPPVARFLTHWYSQSERGSWWSTFNVSHNVGAILAPAIIGTLLYFNPNGWRLAMCVPGTICILGGLFLLNRLRDTPQSLGLPAIEKYRDDYVGVNKKEGEKELDWKKILFEYVLKNRLIWILAAAYFFVYVVRAGITEWTVLFMTETKGYSTIGSNGFALLFEAGGFCGNLAAGWASDYFFSARRSPVTVFFSLGLMATLAAYWCMPPNSPFLDGAALFGLGFFTFGPQMLIGMCAAEFSHKKAAATATGFTGTFAYLGAACAGYPLAIIMQNAGWDGYFLALIACCAVPAVLLAPLWNIKENKAVQEQPLPQPQSAPQTT